MDNKAVYFLGVCMVISASIISYGIIEYVKNYAAANIGLCEIITGGERTAFVLDKVTGTVQFVHPKGRWEIPLKEYKEPLAR